MASATSDNPVAVQLKRAAGSAAGAARAAAAAALRAAEAGDLDEARRQGGIALARLTEVRAAKRAADLLVENLSGASVTGAARVLAMEKGITGAETSNRPPFDSGRGAAGNYLVRVNAADGSVTLTDLHEAGPADDEVLASSGGAPQGDRGDSDRLLIPSPFSYNFKNHIVFDNFFDFGDGIGQIGK